MNPGSIRLLLALLAAVFATVAFSVGDSSAAGRRYCGTFNARGHRLYAYVLRAHAGCAEARRVLKAWFIDAHHTQHYGRWWCVDSHGAALMQGEVQRCSTPPYFRNLIADYDHRL